MKISKILIVAVATTGILAACTEESPITNPPVIKEENVIDRSAFAKGLSCQRFPSTSTFFPLPLAATAAEKPAGPVPKITTS